MKKILVISGSRGEYGYIRPLLKYSFSKQNNIKCDVLVTNMHLLDKYGLSINQFENDNIPVKYKIENTLDGNTDTGMLKSLFLFGLSLVDILKNQKYDLILLAGDRGEQLISSITGFHLNIPIYHIQAGERSGHVDGMSRHAIARFTHVHLAANEDAANRLVNFGEEEFRVHNIGAPQIDELLSLGKEDEKGFLNDMNLDEKEEFILFVYHPVSEDFLDNNNGCINALNEIIRMNIKVIIIYPNSDAGSQTIIKEIESHNSSLISKFRNLSRKKYLYLLKNCLFIIGNSSSGIIEAPFFKKACVNIGRRQNGRYKGLNVVDSDSSLISIRKSIAKVMSTEFKENLKTCDSPYGDGNSTKKLIELLIQHETSQKLIVKDLTC